MKEWFDFQKEQHTIYGDRYFIDKLVLTEGLYVRITMDKPLELSDMMWIRNKYNHSAEFDLYHWFQERDFYSKIPFNDSRKGADMSLQSVNPYTFFCKKSTLPISLDHQKVEKFHGLIDEYFSKLKEIVDRLMYDDKPYIETLKKKTVEVISFFDQFKLIDTSRIKLFIDLPLDVYQVFYDEYVKRKGFVSENTTKIENGIRSGLIGFNNSLNGKKPYISKNNLGINPPFLFSEEDAILSAKLAQVFSQINESSERIMQFDSLGNMVSYRFQQPDRTQPYRDCVIANVETPEDIVDQPSINQVTRKHIANMINHHFLSKQLFKLYDASTNKGISSFIESAKNTIGHSEMISLLISYQEWINAYFQLQETINIFPVFEQIFYMALKKDIQESSFRLHALRKKWDLTINLLYCFSEGRKYHMLPTDAKSALLLVEAYKNNTNETLNIDNDVMFYLMAGQLAYYMLSKNQSKKKTGRLYDPFLQVHQVVELKRELMRQYQVYDYALPFLSNSFFQRVWNAVMLYQPSSNKISIEQRILFFGGLSMKNVFYSAKDEENQQMDESGETNINDQTEEVLS